MWRHSALPPPSVPSLHLSVGGILLSCVQTDGNTTSGNLIFCYLHSLSPVEIRGRWSDWFCRDSIAHLALQRLQVQTLLLQLVLLLSDLLHQLIDSSVLNCHDSLDLKKRTSHQLRCYVLTTFNMTSISLGWREFDGNTVYFKLELNRFRGSITDFILLTWINGIAAWSLSLLSRVVPSNLASSLSILDWMSCASFSPSCTFALTSSAASAAILCLSFSSFPRVFRASSCSCCLLSSSATVPLKAFSLVLMSLIWALVLSTCSFRPWPSCRRPWATTLTSSQEACFSLLGKPSATCTNRVSRRMRSSGIFIFACAVFGLFWKLGMFSLVCSVLRMALWGFYSSLLQQRRPLIGCVGLEVGVDGGWGVESLSQWSLWGPGPWCN